MIAINKAHFPVTVLGYGTRLGIWTQGCSIGCSGCISKDTWEDKLDSLMPIKELLSWCKKFENENLDGITISGGEPFEQPKALEDFLKKIIKWRETLEKDFDILVYSGFSYDYLQKEFPSILKLLDAVVCEPYNQNLETAYLKGSTNQNIVCLSKLGLKRYDEDALYQNQNSKKIQVAVSNGNVWFIGIPQKGTMQTLEEKCLEKGLVLNDNSWIA
ncbi:4Fe-4S cluster-binding domain-containing protein [Sulfurimonas aquatica]|uniref:4Fe-4S cluster-binding domain-containing protein n=1 Tax=Sulfurimonas aquatica TaxID=2672570 RepID=A0A975GDB7_9BACT|nr:4Fe-4S single cluster domain-containing protein [Sulfurimonas aquatica]QSZ42188.1 4Fe-4S cluster-binding domain-containing protein [Sulfurimonas aquatica]